MRSIITAAGALLVLLPGAALGDAFEEKGLTKCVIIVRDGSVEGFTAARRALRRLGAGGLQGFPPEAIFGYVPAGLDEADFGEIDVELVRRWGELAGAGIDPIASHAIDRLMSDRPLIGSERPIDPGPLNDMTLRVPREVLESYKRSGPRRGAPLQIQDRAMDQNSEFLIGSVLINIIFPESDGGSEDWTDEELSNAIGAISLGVSQYSNAANWAGLEFIFNYRDYRRVPVTIEPIEGDWNTDYIWMGQCMEHLGYDRRMWDAHLLNNDMRNKYGTDWVFTAFIVDASANECWQGPEGYYVAYSYLGGPLLLCPFPACRFGTEIGFGHVFIHEMSHTFWALDEYASAEVGCDATAGYLNIPNRNTYFMGGCQALVPCIMNNAALSAPLPICKYTMGQVGLADENLNSIPDIYEEPPGMRFLDIGLAGVDTVLSGDYLIAAEVWNDGVPNMNIRQDPSHRIDYYPWLQGGTYTINTGLPRTLHPSDGDWDESEEDVGFFMTGLEPGLNTITLNVENCVGLTTEVSREVYYVGIKYYRTAAEMGSGYVDLSWITAKELFGAQFDVEREDVTAKEIMRILDTITIPDEEDENSKFFSYRDDTIIPGHEYRYRIVGRFRMMFEGSLTLFEYPSRDIYRTIGLPIVSGIISNVLPNPTEGRTTFTIEIPKSYYDPSDVGTVRSPAASMYPHALDEEKTPVDVSIYNVNGQRIGTIYHRERFGGELTLTWDGTDRTGREVAPGVYFLRVKAGNDVAVKKVVVLR